MLRSPIGQVSQFVRPDKLCNIMQPSTLRPNIMQHLVFEWKKTLAHTHVTPLPVVQDQCESVLDVSKRCVALVLSGEGGGVVDQLDKSIWSENA